MENKSTSFLHNFKQVAYDDIFVIFSHQALLGGSRVGYNLLHYEKLFIRSVSYKKARLKTTRFSLRIALRVHGYDPK